MSDYLRPNFGWDLPPGCTQRDIDIAAGAYDVQCLHCDCTVEQQELSKRGWCESCEEKDGLVDSDCQHGLPNTQHCPQCHMDEVQAEVDLVAQLEKSIRWEQELAAMRDSLVAFIK